MIAEGVTGQAVENRHFVKAQTISESQTLTDRRFPLLQSL